LTLNLFIQNAKRSKVHNNKVQGTTTADFVLLNFVVNLKCNRLITFVVYLR
jgi:hypothetical protein